MARIKQPRRRLLTTNDPFSMRINPEVAAEIGFSESIVFLQFEFLISTSTNWRDGNLWIYDTLEAMIERFFPWWSAPTLSRIIKRLESLHLIYSGNYNPSRQDRTLWYALDWAGVAKLKSVHIADEAPVTTPPAAPSDEDEGADGEQADAGDPAPDETIFQNEICPSETPLEGGIFQNEISSDQNEISTDQIDRLKFQNDRLLRSTETPTETPNRDSTTPNPLAPGGAGGGGDAGNGLAPGGTTGGPLPHSARPSPPPKPAPSPEPPPPADSPSAAHNPETAAWLQSLHIKCWREFAHLPLWPLRARYDELCRAGTVSDPRGALVASLRDCPLTADERAGIVPGPAPWTARASAAAFADPELAGDDAPELERPPWIAAHDWATLRPDLRPYLVGTDYRDGVIVGLDPVLVGAFGFILRPLMAAAPQMRKQVA